jgi:ABC-2 type transport system permease protein
VKRIPTTRLVIEREIRERLQGRLTWVLTAVTALGVVLLIVIPALVHGSGGSTTIGLVGGRAQGLRPTLEATATTARVRINLVDVPSTAVAQEEVKRGSLDVALTVAPASAVAEVKENLSPTIAALLRSTLTEAHLHDVLGGAGVPEGTIKAALTPVTLSTSAISPQPPDQSARRVAALVAGILLYISLGVYVAAVANGVAQEKTSRTAEVLLGAVRPRQLLAGKVVGIGLIGLVQLGIVVIAGLIANAAVQGVKIPHTVWVLLPSSLLFFLLGYAFYAFAMAAAGALVARQEEVQLMTLPLALPVIAGYLLVFAAIASPTAWWIQLLSFFPPLTPVVMPARIALGHVAAWEIVLAVLVMLGSTAAVARVAARIYAAGLVRGGARPSWRTALRLSRSAP